MNRTAGPPPTCGGAPAIACSGGCPVTNPVYHFSTVPCITGGGFDLRGTQYETTCSLGSSCPFGQPILRFWQFDHFGTATQGANNGCQKQDDIANGAEWLVNANLDDGTAIPAGIWYMYQANWAGPMVDGCFNITGVTPRTVAEISDVYSAAEGTPNHGAWFLVGSVGLTTGFNFDLITGATGTCNAATIAKQDVSAVSVQGRSAACVGSTTPTTVTTADTLTGFFDVQINITNPNPAWFNDTGAAPALISGYQIMYKTGAEPTTSVASAWNPVYDPTDATAPKNAMGVIPVGTATALVALPVTTITTNYWFAARAVYADATENPTASFDPLLGTPGLPAGPQVTTPVGAHCGPVNFNPLPMAVNFGSVVAERTAQGVTVRWTTLSEDDTNGFRVVRATGASGTEAAVDAAYVDAHGANLDYVISDLGAGPGTYYYYVQELTSNGPGDRSEIVRVDAATSSNGAGVSGARSRGGVRR